MNDLILERSSFNVGMYNAEVHIEGIYFCASGFTWEDTINRLLSKIVWYFTRKIIWKKKKTI